MKTNLLVLIFTALTILISCNSKQEKIVSYDQGSDEVVSNAEEFSSTIKFTPPVIKADEEVQEEENPKSEFLGDNSTVGEKKIVKDGDISVKTNDIKASKKGIDNLLKKLNAYYEREDFQNNDQTISYDLRIRVPADNFEKLISSIENGKDEIKSKSIQARDITEEYVDIQTRLTNKREYLKRYKELLYKASTVKDILAIEEKVRTLQEEIESKEGRLNFLSKQVSYSALKLNLYTKKEFIYKQQQQDKFFERVKKSLSNGWTSVIDFVLWTIKIWPYILLTLIVYFVIRRIIKKRKSRH